MSIQSISQRFLVPAYQVVTQTTWGRIAAAISCIALVIFAYRTLYVSAHSETDDLCRSLFRSILLVATLQAPQPNWDTPIELNGRRYFALGFQSPKNASFCEIVCSMKMDNRYQQIVHLMEKGGRGNYLDGSDEFQISSLELYLSKGTLGDKLFYNFHGWLDEVPSPEVQGDLIQFVRLFSEEVEKGRVPLIDCPTGLHKTATFIAMVELARDRFKRTPPKEDQLEGIMEGILQDLAKTAKGRIPTAGQLKMLLDLEFLKKLVH